MSKDAPTETNMAPGHASLMQPLDTVVKPPILFVTLSLDVGGAERHLASLLPELSRRGWPVSIYCMNRLGAYAEKVRDAGVQVIAPPVERLPGTQATTTRLLATLRAGSRLVGVMRQLKPSITHFFLPEAYIVGGPTALMLGVPIRIMSRRGLNLYQRNWFGAAAIEKRLHPRMTAILANSRQVVADLVTEGCDPAEIGLIYNGVSVEGLGDAAMDRAAIRSRLGLPADAFVMIVVANLIAYKGYGDLLSALAQIKGQLPANSRLLCVGRDEGDRSRLERMSRELGLAGMVRFLDVRNDVPELLAASDLSILPSHEEGFSNAVIEAMAAGLPLVVTDVGGNAEAVFDGEHGSVVAPKAPHELAAAILALANDADRRKRFGSAGKKRAKEQYSFAASVDRYETVYLGLLAGKRIGDLDLG